MARITKPLTNTEIKQAKAKEKEYSLSDGDGLMLRVKPNGSKIWIFNYSRPFTKKRANLGLGTYPTVPLGQARVTRNVYRTLLAQDIDPKEHRRAEALSQQQIHQDTLKVIAAQWHEVRESEVSSNYHEDTWRSLENHIFPELGSIPISKITAPKVIAVLKPIAAKGSLETIRRLSQRLNQIMVFATNTGIIRTNPLSGIKAAFERPKKQHMITIIPNELPELMSALNIAQNEQYAQR